MKSPFKPYRTEEMDRCDRLGLCVFCKKPLVDGECPLKNWKPKQADDNREEYRAEFFNKLGI